jgi:hybrid cluster-associated redox disulfide protein
MADNTETTSNQKHFTPDMTVAEAMAVHPRVREVFAAFHLGGCAHCAINQYETIGQVCQGYGVDVDTLIEVLDSLLERDEPSQQS